MELRVFAKVPSAAHLWGGPKVQLINAASRGFEAGVSVLRGDTHSHHVAVGALQHLGQERMSTLHLYSVSCLIYLEPAAAAPST